VRDIQFAEGTQRRELQQVISSGGFIRGRVLEVVTKAAVQVLFDSVQVNSAWHDGFYAVCRGQCIWGREWFAWHGN